MLNETVCASCAFCGSKLSDMKRLLSIFTLQFPDSAHAYSLVEEFLSQHTYSKTLCIKLIEVARGSSRASWNLRRLAVLMLEHQVLKISPDNLTDFDFLLTELNLKKQPGPNVALSSSLLKEGYTSTSLRRFIPEFRRKLQRLNRVHANIKGGRTSDEAFRDFLEVSRHDCKLSLGRYLFTADEVAEEILKQLRVTDGARDLDPAEGSLVTSEAKRTLECLPDFEASIFKRLCSSARIYWVSNVTGSEINSLVEYPLSTVVITIKPPGSNIEFEIKRAGRKGDKVLDVVYSRNGYAVAPSHRLDGGDMQWLLRHEARAAAKFSTVYRLVHAAEPPIPCYVSRSTIYSVPVDGHEVQTLMYFTDPNIFEKQFGRMRQAMAEGVAAFNTEGYGKLPDLPGDLGLTAQFISIVSPAQAIISGTTSFRLDKLATYLSDNGPRNYFEGTSRTNYSKHDARRFADALLEEILGVYTPPDVRYQSHKQYVAAALRVPENRSRADTTYLSLLQEIGTLLGTLMGIRGQSRGESFVARNVGLKSVWEGGEWKVKVVFMDHDALGILGPHDTDFYPHEALMGMLLDETYLWGRGRILGTVGHLGRIYQINASVYEQGQELVRIALKKAYKKTLRKLSTDPKVGSLFHAKFVERLQQWDELVAAFLRATSNGGVSEDWKKKIRKAFAKEQRGWFDTHIEALEKHKAFIERQSFLFAPAQRSSTSQT
jgi:hypothetical protein